MKGLLIDMRARCLLCLTKRKAPLKRGFVVFVSVCSIKIRIDVERPVETETPMIGK